MCLGFVPLTFLVSPEILAHFMMGNLDLTLPAYYFCVQRIKIELCKRNMECMHQKLIASSR